MKVILKPKCLYCIFRVVEMIDNKIIDYKVKELSVDEVLDELKDIIIQMQIDIIAKKTVCLDIIKHFFAINK